MILPFSTRWPKDMPEHMAGKPTYFVEKIIEGLLRDSSIEIPRQDWGQYLLYTLVSNYIVGSKEEKLHTIRQDKNDRWKTGMDIHFYINSRTKDMFRFAPVIPCVSTQTISFDHAPGFMQVFIDGAWYGDVYHHGLNDIYDYTTDLENLASNDGFDSLEDFFAYFNTDFTGKIIHWTHLKY